MDRRGDVNRSRAFLTSKEVRTWFEKELLVAIVVIALVVTRRRRHSYD